MRIGTVAKQVGLSVDTIRFYERNSLLPHPTRTPGGFREFRDDDLETLEFIRRAQKLGFALSEVRELLELRRSRRQRCAPVRRRLQQKVRDIRQRVADFRKLESELGAALARCNKEMGKRSAHCPLLRKESPRKRERGR